MFRGCRRKSTNCPQLTVGKCLNTPTNAIAPASGESMARVFGMEFRTDLAATFKSIPTPSALLLITMLFVDIAFIIVSADQDYKGSRNNLHVSLDNGIAEHWQYVKWALLALLLAFMSLGRRSVVYLAWALLFLYLLIDDSQQIHETYGRKIASALEFQPALGLRAQDFGELAVTAIAAVPLFSFLAFAYLLTSQRDPRTFTHDMIVLVVALAFFGVGVDMLEIAIPWSSARTILNLVEDGGEMIVATFMVAYGVGSFLRVRPTRFNEWPP